MRLAGRVCVILLAVAVATAWFLPARTPPPKPSRPGGLAAGVEFLKSVQSPDGAWRSDTYGTFKDGTALTPLAVMALTEAGAAADTTAARKAGSRFLAGFIKPDGTVDEGPFGLDYPVYTAALSVVALSHPDSTDFTPDRDAWLKYLLTRQLTESLGWVSTDKEYGGWGYCRTVPRKLDPGQLSAPLIESNLSATVFALDALAAAGNPDPASVVRGRAFVARCQNPDGGYHFIYDDPVRNKAGSTGAGFPSYGSATADGYRAIATGTPAALAAHRWITDRFDPDRHPGDYIPTHERNRDAVYFYYAAATARVFQLTADRPAADRLAAAVRARQQSDGSWLNPVELVREIDPVLATCWAVLALARCESIPSARTGK